jgi:two-component system, OmpR family, phosphate regulon sensor histidine kinase PhoR
LTAFARTPILLEPDVERIGGARTARRSFAGLGCLMEILVLFFVATGSAVGAYMVWRWRAALAEVANGLDALGAREKVHPVLNKARGPVGGLVRAFNAAANEIEARTARLDQDRQQLLVVLGAMAEAVIAVDLRRRLLFANASANRLFGLDSSSVGRLVPELIRSPQVQDAVEATLRLAVPDAYEGELILPGRDPSHRGHNRFLSVRGNPLPGQPSTGAVFVFHDVTELRRLENMRQDFVANASHELKTPLASIKAYTETLLDWALYDETVNARFLKRIDEQAERLNQLILDLLSLARIESGQEIFEHAPLYLVPVLESCIESHRDRTQTKNLNLIFDPGGLDDDTMVLADEEAIRQIVDNLVDNAIKYTPEGGSVSVICHSDRNLATVEVADTGIGIPRSDLPRIFERFYRVDKARSRELGGTGLGLSIVKHLMQSIGGQIDVTSRVGSGSTFTVHLPRCLVPDEQTKGAARP